MMECPKCHFENIAEAKFCNQCGTKLVFACPQCGHVNPEGSSFCNQCGQSLIHTKFQLKSEDRATRPKSDQNEIVSIPQKDGERRQASIMFSDLSGYTSMNERLDPEEVEEIMHLIKSKAIKIVEHHQGTVNQFVGDEVLALFGIPVTHEDDPVRAVRSAIEIHRLVRQISADMEGRIGVQLKMHTGISSGLVVTQMRDSRDGQYGITGDVVNTGSRLAGIANADEIIVCPKTHRQVAPYFETEPYESTTVKGKTRPLIPYQIIKESTVNTRFDAARKQGLTDFTGRENELATLNACLKGTLSRKGQLVTIVGEAGLGKSRLIFEFRHSLNRHGLTVLQGRCQSYGSSTPYFPHINALRRGLKLDDGDTLNQLHTKIVTNVLSIDPSLEKYLPIYLHLLSVPSEDYPLPDDLHGRELTMAIQDALTACFIFSSKKQPLVLILEDWHWVDDASDALLKHMISLIPSHALMLLVIFRPDYERDMGSWSHHTMLRLNALNQVNCGQIVKSIWSAESLPDGIVSLIHERTGGNPFFVEEVSRALIEEGTIECSKGQAVLTQSLENLSLPNTVQAVIRARLDRLDEFSQESLRLASVVGREFAHRILEQISASKQQLEGALENLKMMELIQQTQVFPEAAYMFKHVITQEVTYKTILKQKRKELHTAVGEAIEALYMDRLEEFYEMLAYHYWRSEKWDKAYRYNREAGLKAQALSAYIEARGFLEASLTALTKLPRTRKHIEQEIDLRFNMRSALFPLGRHDDWADHVRVAQSLAEEIDDKSHLANAYNYLAGHLWIRGRHEEAIKLGMESCRLSQSIGDLSLRVTTRLHLGIPYLYTGEIEKQITLHQEAVILLNGPDILKRHGFTTVPAITLRGYLAWGAAERGDFKNAKVWAGEGLELSGQVKNLMTSVFVRACVGYAYLRKGDLDKALAILLDTLKLSREGEVQSIFSFVAGSLGNVYLHMGQPENALPILIEGVDRRYSESSITPPLYTLATLSEAYLQHGLINKAEDFIKKALDIFHNTGERCFGAWSLLIAAKIHFKTNDERRGEQKLRQAIDIAERLKMWPLQAHCYFELGKSLMKHKDTECQKYFKKSVDLFRSLDMNFWLPDAETLLSKSKNIHGGISSDIREL